MVLYFTETRRWDERLIPRIAEARHKAGVGRCVNPQLPRGFPVTRAPLIVGTSCKGRPAARSVTARRKSMYDNESATQIRLERRSPAHWRVTFDIPPLNIFGPQNMAPLTAIVDALETDKDVRVVVFDSAIEGFFLTHYDFLAKPEDTLSLPPGPTGLQQLPDALVRLSRAPVVSIAKIRGRATGVGSELALASDMRFGSREKAILSAVGGRLRTGAGRRTNGAAAPSHGARPCAGSLAWGRRHPRRRRRTLRLHQSCAAGCRPRRVCR